MGLGITIAVNGKTDSELAQAVSVEVNERMGEAAAFTLRFDLDISKGDLPLLIDKRLDRGSEISIMIPVGNKNYCLIKGLIHSQNIHFEHGGAGSWVDVKGSDTSVKMDRVSQSVVWSDVNDSDAVQSIISKYGYNPDVESTPAGHYENKHVLIQRESDLSFIRRLARYNGFQFWVTSNESGIETAHFRRPPLTGTVTTELKINLDSPIINSLDIEWDVERPTSVEGKQLDLNSKTDIEAAVSQTPQSILGDNGLGTITGDTRSVHLSAAVDDAGDLRARGEGAVIEADWFIHGRCQTTIDMTGSIIRIHEVIKLRGAGSRHSGKYYVSGVKHIINAEEHRMELELLRNGWGR